jgi:polysaccharide export outer membrane protein
MYTKNKIVTVYLFVALMCLFSCFNEKKLTYFQKSIKENDTLAVAKAYIPKIQTGDILSIYVNSLSSEASTFFNPYTASSPSSGAGGGGSSSGSGLSDSSSPGFLVDASGSIELPLVGTVSVIGLTTNQARDIIKKKLEVYLKEPTVNVRFLNYKISILGEVQKPGVYVIPNERVTLPEAITMAGDLTVFGKRNEVEVIRDLNDKKEFAVIDLTSRQVFSSPYYYLHANDIIYVKSDKSKAASTSLFLKIAPIAISAATLIIVILTQL